MVNYFAYGSNMNLTSLLAKGVEPRSSVLATLHGWHLAFDVHHWFRHEGGVGNIHPTSESNAQVQGILHVCDERHLDMLDAVESKGVGYDRVEVEVQTSAGPVVAFVYVGLPGYLDASCLPTQRYLNILVRGATAAGLDEDYIETLRRQPIHQPDDYPPFVHPLDDAPVFNKVALAGEPMFTGLGGAVFDMDACRPKLDCVKELFGGRDMTLFHLKRLDTSDGSESVEDLKQDRVSDAGRKYLNAYLHEYALEFRYVGRYVYD